MKLRASFLAACLLTITSSCSLATKSHPPRIQSRGLIDGHAALGIAAEEHLLHARLFGSKNDGSVVELVLWKLFRFELGIAGASLTLGPLHLGIGTLAYDAEVPRMMGREASESESKQDSPSKERHSSADGLSDVPDAKDAKGVKLGVDGCPECEAALKR